MKCPICDGNIAQELTIDMCYSKEYTCKECGATCMKIKDTLVLTSEPETVLV